MDRTEQQKQLEAFVNRLAGESIVNKRLEARYMLLETDGRAEMLKRLAEEFGTDPSLIDDFDLQGIEAPDFWGFLMEAWEKSGAARPINGPERRAI